MKKFFLLIMLITTVIFVPVKCISELDLTKNLDFILTFLPNYHNSWDSFNQNSGYDSIYIFIYAELPTKGTIEYYDVNGKEYIQNFVITDPSNVYIFKKPTYNYALRGFNRSGIITNNNQVEKPVKMSYRIKSDMPIQVYGHSQANRTSESFNVLPDESLGKEYLIIAYNADNSTIDDDDVRTPSQFAVVSIEDSTEVVITPSASTFYNGMNTQKIILNKGDVYLVQTDLSSLYPDLSRTHILSSKPVAVFSGQQRARVPYNAGGASGTRDFLVEQMPPIDSWGNEAVVVPFPVPSSIQFSSTNTDKLRVIAAYDDTKLYVDNVLTAILNSGEMYEENLVTASHIKANAPIMAAGIKRSSSFSTTIHYIGDPLLQIIPTPNHYGESYRFVSLQAYEGFSKVYTEHYMVIIIDPAFINSIIFDSQFLTGAVFNDIEGSNYKYAHVRILEGPHTIKADAPFGLFICGYGRANSYGYFCGIIAKRDDYEPPQLQSTTECYEVNGEVTDKQLKSVTAPPNFLTNVSVDIETFKPYVKEAHFSAELINKFEDGKFRIVSTDSVGQQSSKDIDIPGFTLTVSSNLADEDDKNVFLYVDSIGVNETKCARFKLKNYGSFKQSIDLSEFKIKYPELSCDLGTKFDLESGKEIVFEICYSSDKSIIVTDTLFISNNCTKRPVLAVNLKIIKDENAPQASGINDNCNSFIDIVITDTLTADTGIDSLNILKIENLKINYTQKDNYIYKFKAEVIDPYQDSYILLTVTDNTGNVSTFEKYLPGYTIDFIDLKNTNDTLRNLDFGKRYFGKRHCDSIKLYNYGKYEIIIENPRLSNNIEFSVPPAQLPIILNPKEEVTLEVCFATFELRYDIKKDTLNFMFNCIEKKFELLCEPDPLALAGNSKCDFPIKFEVVKLQEGTNISAGYPNPVEDIINYEISSDREISVSVEIYDQMGQNVKSLKFGNLEKGAYNLPIDLSGFTASNYFALFSINNEKILRKIVIVR